MSTGRTHAKASLILSGAYLVGTIASGDFSNIQYSVGAFIGVFITPDTDVDNGFETDKIIRTKIGYWAEAIWDVVWYMYRRSLKHGGELSHFPPVGTFGRIAYLFGELIALPHIVYYILFQPAWNLWAVLGWYWGWIYVFWKVVVGLVSADLIHWVLDISTKNAE